MSKPAKITLSVIGTVLFISAVYFCKDIYNRMHSTTPSSDGTSPSSTTTLAETSTTAFDTDVFSNLCLENIERYFAVQFGHKEDVQYMFYSPDREVFEVVFEIDNKTYTAYLKKDDHILDITGLTQYSWGDTPEGIPNRVGLYNSVGVQSIGSRIDENGDMHILTCGTWFFKDMQIVLCLTCESQYITTLPAHDIFIMRGKTECTEEFDRDIAYDGQEETHICADCAATAGHICSDCAATADTCTCDDCEHTHCENGTCDTCGEDECTCDECDNGTRETCTDDNCTCDDCQDESNSGVAK